MSSKIAYRCSQCEKVHQGLPAIVFDAPSYYYGLDEAARLLKGKKATAVWNIHIDLENAGATVIDEPVVVDGNLITARFPYDLPRMVDALVKQLVG